MLPTAAALGLAAALTGAAPAVPAPGAPVSSAAAGSRFAAWLDHDVRAIISREERRAFLELETDGARERFVDAFWASRDPTPGTRRNEYREEIERRVAYADRHFGRDGTRPGSRSDRGRIYVLFGEPQDRREFHTSSYGLYPTELWFYQAPKDVGLPAFFNLIFFKPGGTGDYRLYSPVLHGPEALVGAGALAAASRGHALGLIRRIDPELYRSTISLDPGSGADLSGAQPSMSSQILLAKIDNLPSSAADTRWLRRFVAPEASVETHISFAPFEVEPLLVAWLDRDGVGWLHYEVRVPSEHLALEERGGRYATTIELYVEARERGGRGVVQASEVVPVALEARMVPALGAAPLAIDGRLALAPGTFDVSVLLRNRDTGAFGVGTGRVEVPAGDAPRDGATLSGVLLAVHAEPAGGEAEARAPFATGGYRAFPAGGPLVSVRERPWLVGQVLYPRSAAGPARLVKTLSVERDGTEVFGYMGFVEGNPAFDGGAAPVVEPVQLGEARPGEYRVTLRIQDRAGATLAAQERRFVLAETGPPRPIVITREARPEDVPRELARQYLARGDRDGALAVVERRLAGAGGEERLAMARMLLDEQEGELAARVLEPVLAGADPPPVAHVLAAASFALLGRHGEAARYYELAIAAAGPQVALLNALGESYARAGRPAEARRAFERSLAAAPGQPAVEQALASLGR